MNPSDDNRSFEGFTIYVSPSDYPDHYVLRQWLLKGGETIPLNAVATPINEKALKTIRETMIQMGLVCTPRTDNDDPVILETWM